jgi:hypothetical protein
MTDQTAKLMESVRAATGWNFLLLRLVPAVTVVCVGLLWGTFVVLRPVGLIDSTMEAPQWIEREAVLQSWVPLDPADETVRSSLARPRFICNGVLRTVLYDMDVRLVRESMDTDSAVDLSGYRARVRVWPVVGISLALLVILGLLYACYAAILSKVLGWKLAAKPSASTRA